MNKKNIVNNEREVRFDGFGEFLFNLNANELTALGFIIGYIIGQDLTTNEQGSMGNFLMEVAQTLLVLNSQNQLVQWRKLHPLS